MSKPHKHAELIKAWADGSKIECFISGDWIDADPPLWNEDYQYRIKTEPKPDVVKYVGVHFGEMLEKDDFFISDDYFIINHWPNQLKLTFDSETGKLKSAEIINHD